MSYLHKTLAPDEDVIVVGKIHWMVYAPAALWLFISLLVLLVTFTPVLKIAYPAQAALASSNGASNLPLVGIVFNALGNWTFMITLVLALIAATKAFIFTKTAELAVTTHRALAKFGLIRRHSTELKPDRVEAIVVDQSVMGRIFNYGSIYIQGIGGSTMPIPYIANPLSFRATAIQRMAPANL